MCGELGEFCFSAVGEGVVSFLGDSDFGFFGESGGVSFDSSLALVLALGGLGGSLATSLCDFGFSAGTFKRITNPGRNALAFTVGLSFCSASAVVWYLWAMPKKVSPWRTV